jgi:hypothetical protein
MTMTIPTIPSLPAGYIVTADDMNNLAYACTFLTTKPIAHIRDAVGGTSIGTSAVTCQFSVADVDTDGMYSTSHPERLTVQTPGFYKLRYGIALHSESDIRTNAYVVSTSGSNNPAGSGVTSGECWSSYSYSFQSGTTYATASGVWPFYLYAGDYLYIRAFADGSTSQVISAINSESSYPGSYFSLEFVSV